jgi:hypothetical protein
MSVYGRHRSCYSHAKKPAAGLWEPMFYFTEAYWRKIEEGRRRRIIYVFPFWILIVLVF